MSRLFAAVMMCAACSTGLCSQPPAPRVVLILCNGLSIDDFADAHCPALKAIADRGAVGMMNLAAPRPRYPASGVMVLATGSQTPAAAGDEFAFQSSEPVPGDVGSAAEVFARRTGQWLVYSSNRPLQSRVLHVGIASLARRGIADNLVGTLLKSTTAAHLVVRGNLDGTGANRSASLLTTDRNGISEGDVCQRIDGSTGSGRAAAALIQSPVNLVVLQVASPGAGPTSRSTVRPAAATVNGLLETARIDLDKYDAIIVSSDPPPRADGDSWDRLGPAVAAGPHFPHGLLTSATTRTPGLIANIDVAPTILALFGIRSPVQMTGHRFSSTPPSSGVSPVRCASQLDEMAELNGISVTRIGVPLAVISLAVLVTGFAVRRARGTMAASAFCVVPAMGLNFAAAALLAPVFLPTTVPVYAIEITGIMAAMTAAQALGARTFRTTLPVAGALTCVVIVAADLLLGQHMLKGSMLSGYAQSGIRYYGIGNEYLGITLGCGLFLTCCLTNRERRSSITWKITVIAVWLAVVILMGLPAFGANAGSMPVCGAALAAVLSSVYGGRTSWRTPAAGAVAGLLLAFTFGLAESRAGDRAAPSHMGEALATASHGPGARYLAGIAARKLLMDLRLLVSPWLLVAAAAVALTIVTARILADSAVRDLLDSHPWIRLLTFPTCAAAATSLLFKDSGVVTTVFMLGTECAVILYYLFQPASTI